jgi:hypothetical protein
MPDIIQTTSSAISIETLASVALLRDIPEHNLLRGQSGTVVEQLASGVVEVEFSDTNGCTVEMLPLQVEDLLVLRPAIVPQVA